MKRYRVKVYLVKVAELTVRADSKAEARRVANQYHAQKLLNYEDGPTDQPRVVIE
jgi:hypothetical protein